MVRYRRAEHAFDAPLHDGVMVLNTEAARFHALDPVGAAVWDQLAQPSTLTQLTQRLCARFAVSPDACMRDVAPFLEALVARGLVLADVSPSAPPGGA